MLKFHLIFLISIVSAFLLTVQWIILQMTVKNVSFEVNQQWNLLNLINKLALKNSIPLFVIDAKILKRIKAKQQNNDENDQFKDQLNNLFNSQTFSFKQPYSECEFFCSGQKVIHLATLKEIINYQDLNKFIEQLKAEQLTVLEFNNFDSNLLAQNVHLHLVNHLIIFKNQYSTTTTSTTDIKKSKNSNLIHITIFQEKLNNFWISHSIHLTEFEKRLIHRQGIRKLHFQFSDHNHIYEKVSLETKLIDGLLFNYPEQIDIFLQNTEKSKFIECNKTRAKEFYRQYGDDESETALQFKMNAYRLIYKVKLILDELNIPFWLSSGTCLGYFRQCDFITYSQDVDIGIFIKDYRDDLIDLFSINDLPLVHLFGKKEDSFELSFRNGDVKLDIFFFYEEQDSYWNGGTQAKSGLKFKYTFPKFDLCWTDFLDILVRVPCDTLTYINANYGPNWFKPIKQWDWKSSPNNVAPAGEWPSEEWHQVIQVNPYTDLV